jgi:hypothetical protein
MARKSRRRAPHRQVRAECVTQHMDANILDIRPPRRPKHKPLNQALH